LPEYSPFDEWTRRVVKTVSTQIDFDGAYAPRIGGAEGEEVSARQIGAKQAKTLKKWLEWIPTSQGSVTKRVRKTA
jgi:hypothetical protein